MKTVIVSIDEWYPVYNLEAVNDKDPIAIYSDVVFEMNSEELEAINLVYAEFNAIQRKLANLYELHGGKNDK
jgi:hypothetical protein